MDNLIFRLLEVAWEPITPEQGGEIPCAQTYKGQWYAPKFGCDTLEHMFDELEAKKKGERYDTPKLDR